MNILCVCRCDIHEYVAICLCIVFVDIHVDSVLFIMCSLCIWMYCKWCQCVCLCRNIVCILTSGPFISVFIIIIIRQRVTISVRLCDRLNVGVCFTHRSRSLSSHVRYVVYFMKISQRRALIPHRIADQLTGHARAWLRHAVTSPPRPPLCLFVALNWETTKWLSLVYTFYIYLTTYCNSVNILICLNQKYISSWLEVNIHSKLHIFADILRK